MSYFAFLAEHGSTLLLGTVTTIKVLICSMILYVIISMIFGLMRLSKNLVIQGIATVYIEFFRGTSLLVQLFWVYYVLPFFGISLEAFVAGVVALVTVVDLTFEAKQINAITWLSAQCFGTALLIYYIMARFALVPFLRWLEILAARKVGRVKV